MNTKDYFYLFNEWKRFLVKEDNNILNIDSQIQKAIKKTSELNRQKLKIDILKEGNEYTLIANFVDESNENHIIEEIADISFRKFPYSQVKDQKGIERNAYIIERTKIVKYDLGPLMYDLIIEFVSGDNSVLCPDRFEISSEAQNLWLNYFNKRPEVKTVQLDIENDSLDDKEFPNLTPDWRDDFYQNVSIEDKGKEWFNSPFSKGYYKDNSYVINQLNLNNDIFILNIK